jgi:hypothetical protein
MAEYIYSLFGKAQCSEIVAPIARYSDDALTATHSSTTLVVFCSRVFVQSLAQALEHVAFKLQRSERQLGVFQTFVNQEDATFGNLVSAVSKSHESFATGEEAGKDAISFIICTHMSSHSASLTILQKKLDTLTASLNAKADKETSYLTKVVSCLQKVLPDTPPVTVSSTDTSDVGDTSSASATATDDDDETTATASGGSGDLKALTRKASTVPVSEVVHGLMAMYGVLKAEIDVEKRRVERLKLPFLQRLIEDPSEATKLSMVLRKAAKTTTVPSLVSERSLVVLHNVPNVWMNALEMVLYEVLGSPHFKDVMHNANTGSTKVAHLRCDSFSTAKKLIKHAIINATQSPLLLVVTKDMLTREQLGKVLGIGIAFAETTLSIQASPVSHRPFVRSTGDVNSFAGAVVELQYELLERPAATTSSA